MFRLRSDAEKWFAEVEGKDPIKTKFDLYYFCAMAGLASGRSSDPSKAGVPVKDIVASWIEDYKAAQHLIIGLLVVAELRKSGIDFQEKASVREAFKRLVAPNSAAGLTDEGFKALNAYASGGYEFLAESRDTRPATVDVFLRDYLRLVDEAVAAAA